MVGMIHDMEVRAEGIEQGKASAFVDLVRKGILAEEIASAESGVPFAELELIAAGEQVEKN